MSTDYSSHSEGHQTGLMWYSVYIKKLFNPISLWINPVWYVCWSKSVIFHDDGRQWKLPWNYDSSFTKLAESKSRRDQHWVKCGFSIRVLMRDAKHDFSKVTVVEIVYDAMCLWVVNSKWQLFWRISFGKRKQVLK